MSLPDENKKETGQAGPAEGERRSELRFATDRPATVKFLNPLQADVAVPAMVLESSQAGLRLRLDRDVLPGTLVQIRVDGRVLLGEVRYSKPDGSNYEAGIRLQDVFETNAES